jgi:hypothetical protein
MLLGADPADRAGRNLDVDALAAVADSALERGDGVHDAVRVPARAGLVAGAVAVFEHPHPVVLEDHPIEVGIGDGGIVAAHRGARLVRLEEPVLVGLEYHDGDVGTI